MAAYLYPGDEAGRDFVMRGLQSPVTMLNLMKLRDVTDYTDYPGLAGDTPISGRAAYARYIDHTVLFLKESRGPALKQPRLHPVAYLVQMPALKRLQAASKRLQSPRQLQTS